MKKSIPEAEIQWAPSAADPVGRVFIWKNKVYRAIRKEYADFYKNLAKENVFNELSSKTGLIDTKTTEFALEGFSLILQQEKILFPSYPFEWCGEMFRDCALFICDLSLALGKYGLDLKDAHPYNMMFENYLPKFIDLGSIVIKKGNRWNLERDFILNLLYPLYCMAEGKGEEVRLLFRYELDANRLTQKISQLVSLKHRLRNIILSIKPTNSASTIKNVRNKIKEIKLKSSQTEWSFYSKDTDYFLPFDKKNRWFKKQKNVYQLLRKCQSSTVLDLGSNIGWYAELAAKLGAKVVATDIDEFSLNLLYQRTKKTKLPILPLLVDFRKSSASNITWPAATERLKCDMVLALALTHHLVFKSYLYFDTIARELSNFSRKWLIVEFIPPNDKYIKNWLKEEHYWYSFDNFLTSLSKFFNKIEVLDSAPAPRKLIFCQK